MGETGTLGEVDSVSCGFGGDTVLADAIDIIDDECENVTRSGAGSPILVVCSSFSAGASS